MGISRALGATALLLGLCSTAAPPVHAAGPAAKPVLSTIEEVLVYSDRAQVTRIAKVQVAAAKRKQRLATLPLSVDASSVTVSCKSARVEGVDVALSRAGLPQQAVAEAMADELEQIDDKLRAIAEESSLLQNELSFVASLRLNRPPREGPTPRPPEGLFFSSWQRILRWVEGRSTAIHTRINALQDERKKLKTARRKLEVKAEDLDLRGAERPMLSVSAQLSGHPGTHTVTLTYLVPEVSWKPAYDLRYEPRTSRVEATYYALVTQHSGEDWPKAKLRFSTGQPLNLVTIPELPTWTLGRKRDFIPKPHPRMEYALQPWTPTPAPTPPNVALERLRSLLGIGGRKGGRVGAGATFESTRRQRPWPSKSSPYKRYRFRSSRLEGKLKSPAPEPSVQAAPPAPPAESVDRERDVAVADDRAPAGAAMARPARPRVAQSRYHMRRGSFGGLRANKPADLLPWTEEGYRPPPLPPDSPAAAAQGYIFTLYAPGRHDLPSSYKARRIPVLRTSFAVKPVHRLVPGRSKSAYLLAELQNNTGRPILRGAANLFSGTMFSGRSFINTALPGHTLSLPLGVDDSVKLERHLSQQTVTEGVLFRDDVTEYTVSLEVANHRRRAVRIDLRDQIPKASGKKVEIKVTGFFVDGKKQPAAAATLDRKAGWTAEDDQGRVVWVGTVGPGRVRKLGFSFRIIRPKDWMLRQHGG